MARLSFRCDEELVKRVDEARGMIPREPWLRRAVEQALGGQVASAQSRVVAPTPPTPAEQLDSRAVERALGSAGRRDGPEPSPPATDDRVARTQRPLSGPEEIAAGRLRQDARDALDRLPPEATVRDAGKALEPPISRFLSQPGPNVENVRSSSQAKRGTGPRPKGGK